MIALDADDLLTVADHFAVAPRIVREELKAFLTEAVAHLWGEVVERTPKAHGVLQRSIIGDVTDLGGLGMEGVVGTSLAYATPVEMGTRPHWVPIAPLIEWVRVKANQEGVYFHGVTGVKPRNRDGADARERAIQRIARAVQVAIARRGTLGVGMFHQTEAANAVQVAEQFHACAERIVQRVGAGA